MGMRYSELFRSRIASRKPEFAVPWQASVDQPKTEAVEALKSAGSTGFPVGIMKRMFAGSPSMWEEYLNEAAEKWATNKFVVLVASHDLAYAAAPWSCSVRLLVWAIGSIPNRLIRELTVQRDLK